METRIPARLTDAEDRKFGVTVGGAFLLITAILWWRGRYGALPYLGALGGTLVVAGIIAPKLLHPVHRAWMGLAHLLSKVTTPIFMGVIYFAIVTPVALMMRIIGRRSLVHQATNDSYWIERDDRPGPDQMKRQF